MSKSGKAEPPDLIHDIVKKIMVVPAAFEQFSPSPSVQNGVYCPDQVPHVFSILGDPKCVKKIRGPFQIGSFSAVDTVNV